MKYICSPLVNMGLIKKINSDIYQIIPFFTPHNFETIQQNIIIPESARTYHCSSTMAYGIGQARKLGKQNRKRLENTTDHSSVPSTPSYSYNSLNKYTDISRKKHPLQRHIIEFFCSRQ